MLSVFILRRDVVVARRVQAEVQATRDMRVAGIADTLYQARAALKLREPDLLLTDLQLEDGAALTLIGELRRQSARPSGPAKVVVACVSDTDALCFPTITAGADNLMLDPQGTASPLATIRRTMQGEAWLGAPLARQVLGCMGALGALNMAPPADDRALDWTTEARNPLRLSAGEQRLLVLLAQGEPISGIAVRTGMSVEAIGRRIAILYRKLQWDVRTGSLTLAAA